MATGDVTLSGSTYCETEAEIKAAAEAISLIVPGTDRINIIPWKNGCLVSGTLIAA